MSSSTSAESVIIIGGGVIGTACAWYLSQTGVKVTVIDKGQPGDGCSFQNCGYVCPSHVLPLNRPGALSTTLKAMMKAQSPLYVNPLVGPSLWSWLLRFASHCNPYDMYQAGNARHALLQSSMALYRQLISEQALECEWQDKGLLIVYSDEADMKAAHEENEFMKEHWDVSATPYDGNGLVQLEPALKPGLGGAMHFECDAHLNPGILMQNWRKLNEANGVEYIDDCTVSKLVLEGGSARAVITDRGEFTADSFTIATGALGPVLAKQLGRLLRIQPGKGYSITTSRPDVCPQIPMILHDHRVGVTPLKDSFRLGSTMEFSGYNSTLNRKRMDLLEAGAKQCLHEPRGETTLSEWYGWRPMAANGIPVIAPSSAHKNIYLAAGHSMLGTSMAPATGKLIADMITGQQPHIDPALYA